MSINLDLLRRMQLKRISSIRRRLLQDLHDIYLIPTFIGDPRNIQMNGSWSLGRFWKVKVGKHKLRINNTIYLNYDCIKKSLIYNGSAKKKALPWTSPKLFTRITQSSFVSASFENVKRTNRMNLEDPKHTIPLRGSWMAINGPLHQWPCEHIEWPQICVVVPPNSCILHISKYFPESSSTVSGASWAPWTFFLIFWYVAENGL